MTTVAISGHALAERLQSVLPGIVIEEKPGYAVVAAERIVEAALFLRDDPDFDCKYLNSLTAVDGLDHFDVVYHLSSLAKNQSLVLKARSGHESPVVPSVTDVWLGAHLQEREAYDLMGIVFSGHPAMRRIFLWEGFPGHPLRKDFLALPGGFKPGLQRFPFEFPAGQRDYPTLQHPDSPTAPSVPRLDLPPEPAIPIFEPDTSGRIVENARLPDTGPLEPQGAGTEPSQAGGAAEAPDSRKEAPRGGSPAKEESRRETPASEVKPPEPPETEPPA